MITLALTLLYISIFYVFDLGFNYLLIIYLLIRGLLFSFYGTKFNLFGYLSFSTKNLNVDEIIDLISISLVLVIYFGFTEQLFRFDSILTIPSLTLFFGRIFPRDNK